MAELELTVCKDDCLDCGIGAEVLLWLNDPTKLVANVGQLPEDYIRIITGQITLVEYTCSTVEYTIEYDETLLVDPATLLIYQDIRRFCCSSCYGKYGRELILAAEASGQVDSDDTLEGTGADVNPLGVAISADANNELEARADGLYASVPEICGGAESASQATSDSWPGESMSAALESRTLTIPDVIINNPSSSNTLLLFITHRVKGGGTLSGNQRFNIINNIDPGTGAFDNETFNSGALAGLDERTSSRVLIGSIAPSGSATLRFEAELVKVENDGQTIDDPTLESNIEILGVLA